MTRLYKTTIIKTVLTFAGICIVGVALFIWLKNGGVELLTNLREAYGWWLLLVTIPAHIILSITPLPSEIVATAASLALGFWPGVISSWCAWMVATYIEYHLVKKLGENVVAKHKTKTVQKSPILQKLNPDSPWFLICGLWVPFGVHVVAITSALNNVSIKKVLSYTAIGYAVLSFIFSALAVGLLQII